jgi:phage host-nuclease inhibitor protein Gam
MHMYMRMYMWRTEYNEVNKDEIVAMNKRKTGDIYFGKSGNRYKIRNCDIYQIGAKKNLIVVSDNIPEFCRG